MQTRLLLIAAALTVLWPFSIRAAEHTSSTQPPIVSTTTTTTSPPTESNDEYDGESSRKIIGSRVVTSVSVVLNGQKEPQFTDAAGNYVPRPLVPPRVASPINLLNPDRYEFYTFNDDGDLVKRLMTMKEIQSIVANGDSEQQVMAKNPSGALDSDANIRKIVSNVQKVLNKEIEEKTNATLKVKPTRLDTPDTSSSWSSILPAIFGNTGESIVTNNAAPAAAVGGTPDSVILQTTSKKPIVHKTTSAATASTTTKYKSKPSRRTTPRPSTTQQKNRPNENRIPVKVVNHTNVLSVKRPQLAAQTTISAAPTKHSSVYSWAQSPTKQSSTSIKFGSSSHPIKLSSASRPSTSTHFPAESSLSPLLSAPTRKPANAVKGTLSSLNSITSQKPLQLIGTKAETIIKRPISVNKLSNKPGTKMPSTQGIIIRKTPSTPSSVSFASSTLHKKNKFPYMTEPPSTFNTFILPSYTAAPTTPKIKTKSPSTQAAQTAHSNESRFSTSTPSLVTVKLITVTAEPTTKPTTHERISTTQFASSEASSSTSTVASIQTTEKESFDAPTTELPNVFDSDLSLNQIIEALRDTEATTMTYGFGNAGTNDVYETSTFEDRTMQPPLAIENVNTESVTVYNNGVDYTTHANSASDSIEFKEAMNDRVTYIPQTTFQSHSLISDNSIMDQLTDDSPLILTSMRNEPPSTETFVNVMQHKSGHDEMELKGSSSVNDNSMENLLRESFDNVLQQVQSADRTTTTAASTTAIEYSTIPLLLNGNNNKNATMTSEKKKVVVKPVPEISTEGIDTEPMKYFENVVMQLAKEKDATTTAAAIPTTTKTTTPTTTPTTITTEPAKIENQTKIEPEISTIDATTELLWSTLANRFFGDLTTTEQQQFTESTIDSTESIPSTGTERLLDFSTEAYSTEESQTDAGKSTMQFSDESSTTSVNSDQMAEDSNYIRLVTSTDVNDVASTNFDFASTTLSGELNTDPTDTLLRENLSMATTLAEDDPEAATTDDATTNYEMIKLIETITKQNLLSDNKHAVAAGLKRTPVTSSTNTMERKEDSQETNSSMPFKRDENEFMNLGEKSKHTNEIDILNNGAQNRMPIKAVLTKLQNALDDISKGKLPPTLHSLKKKVTNSIKKSTMIQLDPAPKQALGLEESTVNANDDVLEFAKFCNELAFDFWRALNNEGISSARSIIWSPFGLSSMLAMLFLGVRGSTSSEINDLLHLDDIVTFNPHAVFRNITESVDHNNEPTVLTSTFVREIFSDRSKGKILSFYKEKVQQFYSGYVEEVNFNAVNDIIRRRTNLLVKRYTDGRIVDYLKTNNVWARKPFAGISANIFETNCANASKEERDGEMFFQVLPALRQRRLVPIPAAVWRNGFTAGYDPELDATAVAIGLKDNLVSTIFVMPGQQGHSAPGDNLERLESVLMVNAVRKNAWRRLLATLMERPGLEVQIPRFTHRSFVNTTNALNKLGLKALFDANDADLRGITGSNTRDMYVSDLMQINTFSTCGEDKLAEEHHVEMYPAPPNKYRTIYYDQNQARNRATATKATTTTVNPFASYDVEAQRSFSDPLFDLKYMNLPLPLRPRQARVPETPRLRFDKPFVYFVRHNPTGMILYMGRFNPRLLP